MKKTKTEINKVIPFTTTSKRIKYIGINLTEGVQDLYTANSNTLPEIINN